MTFVEYFKEKAIFIIINLFVLIVTSYLLNGLNVSSYAIFLVCILNFLSNVSFFIYDYLRKSKRYNILLKKLYELDKKYFISDVTSSEDFLEDKILNEIIEKSTKSMKDDIGEAIRNVTEYKEYIELWVHEIKTPIATCKLLIENNENKVTESIEEEILKVENYIEQVLFYARSNAVEKDYYIKKVNLKEIVNESIKKNKNVLIQEKIGIHIHDLEFKVNTDSKWIVFILNQMIQNSVKYRKLDNNLEIEIYAKQGEEKVILYMQDNGIGIEKGEIKRVFEKGFTGTNGRLANKKSTGIGLYLCKNLCQKLGIAIELDSVQGEGTEVRLIFPKATYYDVTSDNNLTEM